MPNLHGRGQHDALAALHGVGWQGRHGVDTLETGDRDNADVVMAQHPEQGAVVSVHITVTLTIGQLTDPGGSGPSSSSSAEPVPEKETSPEQLPPPEDSE
jgi:beta-lactam-binding protein with PASTA domain